MRAQNSGNRLTHSSLRCRALNLALQRILAQVCENRLPCSLTARIAPLCRAGRYWRKFKNPITENLLAPATTINFCPAAPHDFAVTAGARVALYDHEACKERKSLSRFKDTVYSGNFRDDGRLLCAGSARGLVHVVDVTTKAMLRRFRGHRGPVQTTRFASDAVHLLSAGDDCTIR